MKLLSLTLPLLGAAWFDEGHIIGTIVAAKSLTNDELTKIDSIFALWEEQYPDLGNLAMSSIWGDHVKCKGDSYQNGNDICGFDRQDGIGMWDRWHWTARKWIPEGQQKADTGGGCIDLSDQIYHHYPLPYTGVNWMCEQVIKDMKFEGGNDTAKDKWGTLLSTNLQLRLLTHMYTDMHMPSHNIETFAWPHVEGDWVSIDWKIDPDCATLPDKKTEMPFMDIHSLWDSVGMTCTKFYPDVDKDALETRAAALMGKYTKDSFGDRLKGDLDGTNIQKIHDESYAMAIEYTFSNPPFDFSKGGDGAEGGNKPDDCANPPAASALICPDAEYIKKTEEMGESQCVLSGYRLANLLKEIIPILPDASAIKPSNPTGSAWSRPLIHFASGVLLAGAAVVLL